MYFFLSFKTFFSHSKGLRTVMARLRSLIGPSLISPRTKLTGVPTNGLQAVIMLKIPLNQHMYIRMCLYTRIVYVCMYIFVNISSRCSSVLQGISDWYKSPYTFRYEYAAHHDQKVSLALPEVLCGCSHNLSAASQHIRSSVPLSWLKHYWGAEQLCIPCSVHHQYLLLPWQPPTEVSYRVRA